MTTNEARQDAAEASRLDLHEVRVEFKTGRGGRNRVVAANGISLSIGRGEIVGLVGESGSGKSTLGRVMVGLQRPDSGEVRIGGVTRSGRRRLRPGFGRTVQMVFQSPAASLNPKRTVGSILGYAARQAGVGRAASQRRAAEALEEVGISPASDYLRRYPHELSGGQQQRVAIARALLYEPEYLVADEPTSALDVSVRVQIIELIRTLQHTRRMGILFITHDLSVVRALADRAVVMFRGDIVEAGSVGDIFLSPQNEYTQTLLKSTPKLEPPAWFVDENSEPEHEEG
ncbi:ABC transporter ATP-binding protein [Microbacterium esteraromaticum]|uniref:ABC transporter ATP-binding protein n=1 Tax=Microbacterium esteraromaticum TaxID=57043 RepID=A0A7D7WCM0_9MICO|nr:ABC transporter ATP-binding protein [Microbacterium esteraromaticum]QMU95911.1 ABC transporter ATP-binding protein [Microbacterium esteraromaticum]